MRVVFLKGTYQSGDGYVSRRSSWEKICLEHRCEFPEIERCVPGSFNVKIENPPDGYIPPGEGCYLRMAQDAEHQAHPYVSPRARVTRINGIALTAWIYRGGHCPKVLELLSCESIRCRLGVEPGASLVIELEEVEEGLPGMPSAPVPDRA